MVEEGKITSRHFLRRKARARSRRLERRPENFDSWGHRRYDYRVQRATRGRYARWYVVRYGERWQ